MKLHCWAGDDGIPRLCRNRPIPITEDDSFKKLRAGDWESPADTVLHTDECFEYLFGFLPEKGRIYIVTIERRLEPCEV